MLSLRPYQTAQLDEVRSHLRDGARSICLQGATGSGKTAMAAQMLSSAQQRGKASFFITHRREILKQAVETLTNAAALEVGIVAAGMPVSGHTVQVCSIGSLPRRLEKLPKPDLIIWDECHHIAANSWAKLYERFPNAVHVGLSATPARLDSTGLGKWFQRLVLGPSVADLISQGYLSKYRMFAPGKLDLSGIHTVAGDYNKSELDTLLSKSKITGDCLSHYKTFTMRKRAIVFAWSIEASERIAASFNEAGIAAAHVDGETSASERDKAVAAFKAGRVKVLTNVDLFGEGYNVPAIEAAFLLRPTQSLSVYLQQVGRALRPAPDKPEALIFDHSGNCFRHGLPDDDREWSLEGTGKPKGKQECPVRQCPSCYAVVRISAQFCKYCHVVFTPKPRKVAQVEGELTEVQKAEKRAVELDEQRNCQSFGSLMALAKQRGYKNPFYWAKHVFGSRQKRDGALKGTA